jgi:hypothetical protein
MVVMGQKQCLLVLVLELQSRELHEHLLGAAELSYKDLASIP